MSVETTNSVQSLDRAFGLLERLADAGGSASISELANKTGLPLPTIHRLVRSLVAGGYVRQLPSRRYALGPSLIRLGTAAEHLLGDWAMPHLEQVVDEVGESANLAVLDGDAVVYVAQVPSPHSMRMFTEVGRRVSPHCTAVGKALLARMTDEQAADLLGRTDLVAHTPHTVTDPDVYLRELAGVRERGYALDEGEMELGVRCVAVALPGGPARAAISVSGPTIRMTDELVARAVPRLLASAEGLAAELGDPGPA
jgi:IclR family acetate operon transcriptional repressor